MTEKKNEYVAWEELVVDETLNMRMYPPTEAEIKALAQSILTQGQLQPCGYRMNGKNRQLIYGYSRWRAIRYLNEVLGKDIKLWIVRRNVNDADAFEQCIDENLRRGAISPMDKAHAMRRQIDVYGRTVEHVAVRFGLTTKSVQNHLKLNNLIEPMRQAVHRGEIPMVHGLRIAGLSDADQKKAFHDLQEGTVTTKEVATKLRPIGKRIQRALVGDMETEGARLLNEGMEDEADIIIQQVRLLEAIFGENPNFEEVHPFVRARLKALTTTKKKKKAKKKKA